MKTRGWWKHGVLLFLFFSLPLLGGTLVRESYVSLVQRSDLIVRGKVTDLSPDRIYAQLGVVRVQIEIQSLVKGKYAAKSLWIEGFRSDGGPNRSLRNVVPTTQQGEEVFVCLVNVKGRWEVAGALQGKLSIIDGRIEGSEVSADEFASDVRKFVDGQTSKITLRGIDPSDYSLRLSSLRKVTETPCGGGDNYPYAWLAAGCGVTRWVRWKDNGFPVTFHINPAGAVDSNGVQLSFARVKAAVQNALQSWADVPGCYISYQIASDSTSGDDCDGTSAIVWVDLYDGWGGLALGQAVGEDNYATGADVQLNTDYRWNADGANYPASCGHTMDIENIVIHEIGHNWGLDHVNDTEATMYTGVSYCEVKKRTLESGDKEGAVFLNREVSGTISSSVTWCGDGPPYAQILVTGNVTVASGVTLTITDGAIVKFSPGTAMTVYGTLDATGVTFTSSSPSSTWSGIVISGSGANNSSLENCIVERVVTYGGSAVTVDGATGVKIHYCTISNNSNYGTSGVSFIDAGNPEVYHNTINSNGSYGVRFQNTSGNIWSNTITSNSTGGVYCYSSASPSFGKTGYYYSTSSGNNTISGGSYGVYASSYSSPYIGSQSTSSYGYNRIMSNTTARVYAGSYCNPLAEQNWWGSNPPDAGWFQLYDGSSSIDWNPYLTSDPGPAARRAEVARVPFPLLSEELAAPYLNYDWRESLRRAVELRVSAKFNEAKKEAEEVLRSSTDPDAAVYAASELVQIHRETREEGIIAFTRSMLVEKRGSEPVVKFMLARMLLLREDKREAINLLEEIAADDSCDELRKLSLLGLFHSRYASSSHWAELEAPLEALLRSYADDPDVKEALWLSQLRKGLVPELESPQERSAGVSSLNALRLDNFPNPFNPSTIITYSMPSDGLVSLKVFDVLGREVVTLVNGFRMAGSHVAKFDASGLPSGAYLARLEIEGKSVTKKLLFAK